MCFDFLYNCCLKHFIPKRNQRVLSQRRTHLYVKCPFILSDFNGTSTRSTDFSKNSQMPNFMKICPLKRELFHAGGRMDMHDEANANAPYKPQAVVTTVLHSASFIAVLSTAVVTICRRLRSVHSGRTCLLLCCGTTVSASPFIQVTTMSSLFLGVTRRRLVFIHRRFETTTRFKLHGSSCEGW